MATTGETTTTTTAATSDSKSSSSSSKPNPNPHSRTIHIPTSHPLDLNSTATALAVVPPNRYLWKRVDRLRSLYDKAYLKWPPHINLVYPFVRPELLDAAVSRVGEALRQRTAKGNEEGEKKDRPKLKVCLDHVGVFERGKRENTIYLAPKEEEGLRELREVVVDALGSQEGDGEGRTGKKKSTGKPFSPHMTIAQSEDAKSDSHKFLVDKVGLVPDFEWTVEELAVLIRERDPAAPGGSVMRLWGTVNIMDGTVKKLDKLEEFYPGKLGKEKEGEAVSRSWASEPLEEEEEDPNVPATEDSLYSTQSYYFNDELDRWVPFSAAAQMFMEDYDDRENPTTLTVASYNVLAEFEHPASGARYPLVVDNILASDAEADVLVLQEVTDGFLAHLLADPRVRDTYPYSSHGPPGQSDVEPLPSYLNIVVLSKLPFDWDYVSLNRKHKGAVIARFYDVARYFDDDDERSPAELVLAAVHLSQGLTDGAVAAKKSDIRRLLGYIASEYRDHPLILAGDFNLTTSAASIAAAVKKKTLSESGAQHLASIDELLVEAGLEDAWQVTSGRDEEEEDKEEARKGEEGATWEPAANKLAAAMAAAGGGVHPQRYDRILVRGEEVLEIKGFNMFGFRTEKKGGEEMFASDHWGIRCVMDIRDPGEEEEVRESESESGEQEVEAKEEETTKDEGKISPEIASLVVPVNLRKAPEQLSAPGSIKATLAELGVIPTQEDAAKREQALELLKRVILDTSAGTNTNPREQPALVITPVGSYALGVWTSSSDMDVMCIGPFSANTFFALASQRLRRAAASGADLRILRRVRAHTGTMLELEVCGVKVDLQYCPAAAVAQRWPDVLSAAPPTDPIWSLPPQTLNKLKAARDLDYLRRSVPDLAVFQAAHRFIKTWAKARGIYSARFGYLSGIQIAILLARVYKLLVASPSPPAAEDDDNARRPPPSLEDLVATFFAHYAEFDWATQLAFDPFFHRKRLPYVRTAREPLAILGYFPPALNTALAASVPSAKTIAAELARARDALFPSSSASSGAVPAVPSSWSEFLRNGNDGEKTSAAAAAADEFLAAHPSYVRIDVQYWGLGLARGTQLLGWLESRFVMLLVDLQRRAPGLHARIWPARFVERDQQQQQQQQQQDGAAAVAGHRSGEEEEDGEATAVRDFTGCYLIGLSRARPDMDREEVSNAIGALRTALARFEAQLRGEERYFDPRCCWLGASVVARNELGALELDNREWGEYTPGEEEVEDPEEEEEALAAAGLQPVDDDEGSGSGRESDEPGAGGSKKKTGKGGKKNKKGSSKKPIAVKDLRADKTRKFRTAADAMNRIRWDPQLDSSDYVVGYEDRFVGAMEKDLSAWKAEQTDEEFIPQHRILYFRRKSDGKVVWDRRTRYDELFGNV